jgi:uncharacterized protein (TIGR03067 family)
MVTGCWLVLPVGLLVGLATPDKVVKQETERLQGRWKCDRLETDGRALSAVEVELNGPRLRVRGDALEEFDGERRCRFGIDPTASPKRIDVREEQPAKKGVVPVMRGIYSLDGDKLTICFGVCQAMVADKDGSILDFSCDRPTEFTAAAGSSRILLVFRRQGPERATAPRGQ